MENSRLLFTSLHPSVTSSLLRSHLNQFTSSSSSDPLGITDIKVVTRKDGTSRCIAFVGFKSRHQAEQVLQWSRNSWIQGDKGKGGSRVKVDWAKDTKDSELPAFKRQKLQHNNNNGHDSKNNIKGGETSDSRFKDFLAVMAPPKPSTLHDTSEITTSTTTTTTTLLRLGEGGGEEETTTTPTRKKKTKNDENSSSSEQIEDIATTSSISTPTIPNDNAAQDETLTDAEYLAKRMKRKFDSVEDPTRSGQGQGEGEDGGELKFEQDDGDKKEDNKEREEDEEEEETSNNNLTISSILETGRLFLRNLAFSVTQSDLESLFSGYGQLNQVHVPLDKQTLEPKGLAYITFQSPDSAVQAFKALDGRTFQGRLLHILPAIGRLARPDINNRSSEGNNNNNSLKQERLQARKQTGGKSFSWGTLYLNQNAALSAVADRLGVSKAELLDPSTSGDPAIKVALAEAHTIGEIKQYFENEGVNVESFSSINNNRGPRSSTTILIKNLPYATSSTSLNHLLMPFGTPNRLLIPPSGTIAIVDMPDQISAQEAWRGLLYKNFGGSVLYLEKAPSSIWEGSPSASASGEGNIKPVTTTTYNDSTTTTTTMTNTSASSSDETATGVGATLFIKNLNFITTSSRLVSQFSHLEGFTFSRVQTKPDPHNPGGGKPLSMGYGFIGFKTVQQATKAKDFLQTQVLDGHQLEIKFAQRGTTSTTTTTTTDSKKGKSSSNNVSETTTKMLVKNVPFEATRKELRQLFSAYGQLKSVRLPRKMDNSTRGFAFLDFATRRDAESAFSAMEHVHLLGRHLVLQWAGGEGEEEAGGKGKGQFALDPSTSKKNLSHKKSKFTMDTTE